ncbi:hypothetical protein MMC31_005400 [Peltigera leucophlebia]|nr:hypothetical protein [Peltigera leucophlebia]
MLRSSPDALALFSLCPLNAGALEVVSDPENSHLVYTSPDSYPALDIGFHTCSDEETILAELGRSSSSVVRLGGPTFSRHQCSFQIDNPSTGVVMLHDLSTTRTTQVYGIDALQYEIGRPRLIVVAKDLNIEVGIGGPNCNLIRFRLDWHREASEIFTKYPTKALRSQRRRLLSLHGSLRNQRLAKTIHVVPTKAPTRLHTRNHTPAGCSLLTRYATVCPLGAGKFGEVYRAIDVDSGDIIAVKIINRQMEWDDMCWKNMRGEFDNLGMISHPHIIEQLAWNWADEKIEIFLRLKEGSVNELIENGFFHNENKKIADDLLFQMLQALDFLASKEIIHRNLKPANILYTTSTDGYLFQLTDFGICNPTGEDLAYARGPSYLAPELYESKTPHTSKVDVWSLFVTLSYALNAAGIQQNSLETKEEMINATLAATMDPDFHAIKDMAIIDPDARASAAQMLAKLYGGKSPTPQSTNFSAAPVTPRKSTTKGMLESHHRALRSNTRGIGARRSRQKRKLDLNIDFFKFGLST